MGYQNIYAYFFKYKVIIRQTSSVDLRGPSLKPKTKPPKQLKQAKPVIMTIFESKL